MENTRTIDLNADLGEGFPWDEALLDRVTSASVSCGFHAGDRETILATLRAAKARGVDVGAHPGFADREHFGRREQAIDAAEAEALVVEQVESLASLAAEVGIPLRFLKPHGALYNQAQRDPAVAAGVVAAAARLGLPIFGQPNSCVAAECRRVGLRFVAEGSPDRRYLDDGRLAPRSEPRATLDDPADVLAQLDRLLRPDLGLATLCLHGDHPASARLADLLREALDRDSIAVENVLSSLSL
ncbi:MAG TPA: 5-oxoprolinase subunit PxpA [Isosphaeraceae bacterium]|nr:5-oxoprolinase subunit PxpA [Isosphaeraceae bacterium]